MPILAVLVLAAIGAWLFDGGKDVSNDGHVAGRVRRGGRGKPRSGDRVPRGSRKRVKKGKSDEVAPGKQGDSDAVRSESRSNLDRERDGTPAEDPGVTPAPEKEEAK